MQNNHNLNDLEKASAGPAEQAVGRILESRNAANPRSDRPHDAAVEKVELRMADLSGWAERGENLSDAKLFRGGRWNRVNIPVKYSANFTGSRSSHGPRSRCGALIAATAANLLRLKQNPNQRPFCDTSSSPLFGRRVRIKDSPPREFQGFVGTPAAWKCLDLSKVITYYER
jgi:hypothetical protein